jgi:undecaprenyl diphosphate synthase
MKNVPIHIALIPDGNRRWARKRGLPPWLGHQAGSKALEKILEKSQELKIPYFTFWGGSWDNLTKRSKTEVNFLFKVYTERFQKILKDKRVHQNKVKINVFGRWKEILPKKTQKVIKKALETTKNYGKYFLTFLLAYDGVDEMLDCIRKIVRKAAGNPAKITKELIKENLWTKDLPPVDLVIRTGCEDDPHNSAGFMMWDTTYSQFYFTKTLFPDFSPEEFEKIIKDYSKRERRLGA